MAPTATGPATEAAPLSSGPAPSKWLKEKFTHIIDGKQYDQPNAAWLDVLNPATEEPVARVPIADKATVDLAVDSARKAFQQWKTTSRAERAARITAWYEESYKPLFDTDIVDLLIAEQGRNRQLAEFEFRAAVPPFFKMDDYPVIEEEEVVSKREDPDGTTHTSVLKAYPLGVVAGLIPWNYPIVLALWKVIPALLTGNCIILKPSPFTPLATLRVLLAAQPHFPPGVLSVLCGDDSLGPLLSEYPAGGIDAIHFTGSTATAKLVAKSCASQLRKCTLEAGGQDAFIATSSVRDREGGVKELAKQAFVASLQNSGQFCAAAKRLYIHESIYDEFAKEFVDIVKASPMGNGAHKDTVFGPVATLPQRKKVEEFILDIQANNYKVFTGGQLVPGPGYFIQPTVVDNPPDNSKIVNEEPFGPVVPLLKWSDEEEVIARANNSIYGLAASVWGDDETARRIAEKLDVGTAFLNELQSFSPAVPFAGLKQSGMGGCHGRRGLEEYMAFKSIRATTKPARL